MVARTGYFIPVRDGMGVGDVGKFFRRRRRRRRRHRRPPKVCVFWLTFSSPLDLITEIWMRYCREIAQNCVLRLFGFHKKTGKSLEFHNKYNLLLPNFAFCSKIIPNNVSK